MLFVGLNFGPPIQIDSNKIHTFRFFYYKSCTPVLSTTLTYSVTQRSQSCLVLYVVPY
jgi:hypothetical protein